MMYKKLLIFCIFIFATSYSMQQNVGFVLGTLSATAATATMYEIGKRNYIPSLTHYIQDGCGPMVISIDMNKIGCDPYLWGFGLAVSARLWKSIPAFRTMNKGWALGSILGSIVLASTWAQMAPEKYNPFVWLDKFGSEKSVLIFTDNKRGHCNLFIRSLSRPKGPKLIQSN